MRYKRENTLALDVSAMPNEHRVPIVQLLLTFLELDPARLRSVQFHSSRKTIFIGLPNDLSAAAIAAKKSHLGICINGTKHFVPLQFVDEDVVEVRVRDLPPETPTELVHQTLRQYGEVLSVINEVWRDFFPGVPTGIKIARMKVAQTIPSRIPIGNSIAVICYDGQPRNNRPPNAESKAENKKSPLALDTQQQSGENTTAGKQQQKQQPQQQHSKRSKINPPSSDSMDTSEPSTTDFTVVSRRKGKVTQRVEQQQPTPPNPASPGPGTFDVEALKVPLKAAFDEIMRIGEENKRKRENNNKNNIK